MYRPLLQHAVVVEYDKWEVRVSVISQFRMPKYVCVLSNDIPCVSDTSIDNYAYLNTCFSTRLQDELVLITSVVSSISPVI